MSIPLQIPGGVFLYQGVSDSLIRMVFSSLLVSQNFEWIQIPDQNGQEQV